MNTFQITIDVVKGGFVLEYPEIITGEDGQQVTKFSREVFVSPRKLNQKIKELIDSVGLVADKD